MNLELLSIYYNSGLSLLPVNGKNPAISSWKNRQEKPVKPNGEFSEKNVTGVGIVCGRVSGGLEIMDFDLKNDATKTLMSDFKSVLNNDSLLKRLVVQKTPSGGFHFIYKCEEIEGNQKLTY